MSLAGLLNLILTATFFSSLALANENVNVYREDDGSIVLTGENCDFIKRQTSALSIWKKNLSESPAKLTSACSCDSFRCYMTVNEVMPDFAKNYQNVKTGRWGPNCWNAVLVASKILPIARFSPPEEMSFWMTSPLCKEVPDNETPQPGDIAAIRDSNLNEVHASVFVTEELFFSKNSLTTQDSYQLQSSQGIFLIFPVQFMCRHRNGNPLDCGTYVNYYRCSSFADYNKNQNVILSDRYLQLEALVFEHEQMLSKIIFEWKTNPELQHASAEILQNIQIKIKGVRDEVINRSGDITTTLDQRLIWTGLRFRIQGLLLSIDWI